jgi:hypothetical protein
VVGYIAHNLADHRGTKWVNDLVKVMSYKKRELRLRATKQGAELNNEG